MTVTDLATVSAHFASHDSKIATVLKTVDLNEWFEEGTPENYFIQLCRTIIYQQLAGKAASTIYSRFADLIGGRVDPEHIASLELQQLRDVGLSWAKAKYIKDLTEKTITGEVVLNNLHDLSDGDVIAELTKVKGIGQWTAEMFLMFRLHRENVFSYGDLGLKNGFAKLYGIDNPTIDDMQPIVDMWSPYKTYGAISLWHYLDNR